MSISEFKVKRITTGNEPRWKQYADLVVGKTNLWSLLKYEIVTFFVGSLPGALGLFLRSKLYPFVLGSVGQNVVFGRNVTLRHPHKILIGSGTIIDDYCLLDAKGDTKSGISIGQSTYIGRNSLVYCRDGKIEIQDHVNISSFCEVFSSQQVVIGSGTIVGAYSYIMSGGSYKIGSSVEFGKQDSYAKGSTMIGEGCWLGAKTIVLDGVRIGKGCVVGSGAVVNEEIPDFSIAAPDRRIFFRDRGACKEVK